MGKVMVIGSYFDTLVFDYVCGGKEVPFSRNMASAVVVFMVLW